MDLKSMLRPPPSLPDSKDVWDIRALPAEVRIQIWRECFLLGSQVSAEMPSLIVALRPDKQLYDEAIDVFRSTVMLRIRGPSRRHIPREVLEKVRLVEISDA